MLWGQMKRFVSDTSGAAFVYVGLVLTAITGFVGLAVDVGSHYSTQRAAQSASDAAAVAGAFELLWGGDTLAIKAAAENQASENGFDASLVTVNVPPTSGTSTTDPNAVEVIITRPTPGYFSSIFFQKSPVDITTRSVAAQVAGVPMCIVALEPSNQALFLNSNSSVQANGCMLHVNSSDTSAVETNSGSSITADAINVVGDYTGSGISPTPETGVPPMPDPLAYLQPPANAGAPCDHTGLSTTGTLTLNPGVYCNDLIVNSGSDVTFSAGTYIIRGGKFEVNSGSTVQTNSGAGVTFFITGDAQVVLNSGSHANLEAPMTGQFVGILFYQDPNDSETDHLFNSDSSSEFLGAVYFPNGKIMINSGSTLGGTAPFSTFVAKTFEINSNSNLVLNSNYSATNIPGVPALGAQKIALFE